MKDYKRILQGVVNIINTTKKSDIGFANICTYIGENCPELKESEDERIREALIRFHKSTIDVDGIKGEDIIAWLEAQGEHANFRNAIQVGDKVTRNRDGVLVNLSQLNRVAKKQGEHDMGISEATKQKLEDNLHKALEKETPESWNEFLDEQGEQKSVDGVKPKFHEGDIIRHKEQGFTCKIIAIDTEYRLSGCNGNHLPFDSQDAYELVEQKPAEEVNGEDYGIDGLWHAQRILEKTLGEVDGYQSDDGILEHKCAISAVKKLYEKKPIAWSEEDERIYQSIMDDTVQENQLDDKQTDWLKSLKDRYTWKPSDEHYELEEFAKIVRCNLTGISKAVQELFEAKYLQLTGNKMYGGYKD